MGVSFLKMHGLGNDFVIIDLRGGATLPNRKTIMAIADRRRGVGCDQIIFLEKPKADGADVFMRIYNPDGSEAGACGNATRCVAKILFEDAKKKEAAVETVSGLLNASARENGIIAVDMGEPRLKWSEIPLAREMDTLKVDMRSGEYSEPCCVNMGNPHAVFFVKNADAVDLETMGPKLENHPVFPQRSNIEFAHIIEEGRIRMRVWERGAGVTQACGTGACATLVAAARLGLNGRKATITLDGGDLHIEWNERNRVIMSGPAALAFRGEIAQTELD